MKTISKGFLGIIGGAAGVALAFGIRHRNVYRRKIERIEDALGVEEPMTVFHEALVADLPEPARRYFLHSIKPGTPLALSVQLFIEGRMKPREDANPIDLRAEQILAPPRGFVWKARLRMGPVPVRVVDHYLLNSGGVNVSALGILPLGSMEGPDTSRSSRHRLAAESVWMPMAFLPGPKAAWEAVDDTHARVSVDIDGETIPLTLQIDEIGRLREITMQRYGDVKVEKCQLIPYGMSVEEEQSFGGFTIPTKVRGGWWYGTEQYDPADAAYFHVRQAYFR